MSAKYLGMAVVVIGLLYVGAAVAAIVIVWPDAVERMRDGPQ